MVVTMSEAGPGARLVASAVNWGAAIVALVVLAAVAHQSPGRSIVVALALVIGVPSLAGGGLGELVAGTRVVDLDGGRLPVGRGLLRGVVQVAISWAAGLAGWAAGLFAVSVPTALVGHWSPGAAMLGALVGALAAFVLVEPFFVRVTGSTPWDGAARSTVARRGPAVQG